MCPNTESEYAFKRGDAGRLGRATLGSRLLAAGADNSFQKTGRGTFLPHDAREGDLPWWLARVERVGTRQGPGSLPALRGPSNGPSRTFRRTGPGKTLRLWRPVLRFNPAGVLVVMGPDR